MATGAHDRKPNHKMRIKLGVFVTEDSIVDTSTLEPSNITFLYLLTLVDNRYILARWTRNYFKHGREKNPTQKNTATTTICMDVQAKDSEAPIL